MPNPKEDYTSTQTRFEERLRHLREIYTSSSTFEERRRIVRQAYIICPTPISQNVITPTSTSSQLERY